MKLLLFFVLCFGLAAQSFNFKEYNRVLQTYVDSAGFVDYKGILENEKKTIYALVDQLNQFSPKSHPKKFKTKKAEMVYWINAYNVYIIKTIIDEYPIESIKDITLIGALIWKRGHAIGGEELSFDNIEHDILRKQFMEPRIHFAINCASYGCPILQNEAFTTKNLEHLLKKGTVDFFNGERNFRIDHDEKTVYLSSILDWFSEDFYNEDKNETILDFVVRYAPKEIAAEVEKIKSDYSVSYIPYDWKLNEQARE